MEGGIDWKKKTFKNNDFLSEFVFRRFLKEPFVVLIDGLTKAAQWSIEVYHKIKRQGSILIVHCFQINGSLSSDDFEKI
jgi:hypothetical protein